MPKTINGISEIISEYELVLCDLWGVIHDGSNLYTNARSTLIKLKEAGKKLVFLSNAPRRSNIVVNVLHNLGIESNLYDGVITSGEVGFQQIKSNPEQYFNIRTRNYYYLGPDKDSEVISETRFGKTLKPNKADFVICTGFIDDDDALVSYVPILKELRDASVPMICVNPDLLVVKLDGRRINCSGQIANLYESMGGKVYNFGKPFRAVYDSLLAKYAKGIPTNKIIAIGDGIETDIKGAADAGIGSVLVTGGIMKVQLGLKDGEVPDTQTLNAQIEEAGASPDFVISSFCW